MTARLLLTASEKVVKAGCKSWIVRELGSSDVLELNRIRSVAFIMGRWSRNIEKMDMAGFQKDLSLILVAHLVTGDN